MSNTPEAICPLTLPTGAAALCRPDCAWHDGRCALNRLADGGSGGDLADLVEALEKIGQVLERRLR